MKKFNRRIKDMVASVRPHTTKRPIGRTDEVLALAANFRRVNPPGAAEIACLWHLAYTQLCALAAAQGSNLTPLIDNLRIALHQRAIDTGISAAAVQRALLDLQRAGETAAYLNALPD